MEGDRRVVRGTFAGSASYSTGGEAVTLASLGMSGLEQLRVFPKTGTKEVRWDGSKTAPKLIISVADVQVAAASDQTTATGTFEAVGRT